MISFVNAHRRMPILAGAALALSALLSPLRAQKQSFVFVENSRSGDISIIDAATLAVTGTIQIGASPDEIVASPSGDMLYVSRIVRRDDNRPTGGGEIVAVDPAARTVVWRAAFRGTPNHVAVSPDGRKVYVTIVSGSWVDIIDVAQRAMVDSVEVGTGPHDIEISRDGKHVYVGLIRGTDVTEFDAATKQVIRKIPMGQNVRPIALTHDEKMLFVQLSHTHAFMVVDPATGKIIKKVPMPLPEGKTLPDSLPTDVNHGLRVTANGKFLIANGSLYDLTSIWSLPDLKLIATIPVGHDPNWIVVSPDGKRAFVSNRQSDDVSVIDLAAHREIARVKVGKYPQRMAAVAVAAK